MTKQINEQLFQKALTLISRASFEIAPVLYASGSGDDSGGEITADVRDELLRKLAAGEYVAVDVDILAYEQRAGVANRNYVRFRDGALIALGASARSKPFLRDHMQWSSLAVAGKILTSKTTKLGDGHYEIRMRARLTAAWAVELALRGLLHAVSIGWEPTGIIECSVCNANIRRDGWACHWPGERVTETPQADGTKRYVRDRNGVLVVEWVYTQAEIIETSMCPIGGVRLAGFEGVRAALSAAGALSDDESRQLEQLAGYSTPADPPQQTGATMSDKPAPTPPTIVVLTAEQSAHYAKLSPADQAAFAAKSSADRDAEVKAARDADPVLYTTKDGTEIRKSDGSIALMLAKQADAAADREALAAQREQQERATRQASELAARAKTTLAGMHGADEVHVAILGAIDSIADEKLRASALQSLNAWRVAATGGGNKLTPPGGNPEEPAPASAQAQLDANVAKYAEEHKLTPRKALLAYVKTDEGRKLYAQINAQHLSKSASAEASA